MARPKKQRIIKITDLGPEPISVRSTSQLLRAYQWYNYEYTQKDGLKFVAAYATSNLPKAQALAIKALPIEAISPTFMWQCRMLTNGLVLPDTSRAYFDATLAALLVTAESRSKTVKLPVAAVAKMYKPTVQDRIREMVSEFIGEIEIVVDNLGTAVKSDFNMYEFLQAKAVKKPQASKILAYYQPIRDEVALAVSGKDEQLNEAYAFMSKVALKRVLTFFDTMLSDLDRHINNQKATRKPRAKKMKSAGQLVQSLKYMKISNESKISSIAPEKIVGATQLWVFNVKYKKLGVLNADVGGFSIKGTTIQNVKLDDSAAKRLRKPEVTLPLLLGSGKIQLRKFLSTIKAKESPMTGRINEDTLLLRVI